MCGIVVEFSKKKIFPDSHIGQMLDAISHRGFDHRYFNSHPLYQVGYCRLSITDRDIALPSFSKWNIYLNGEIYNYRELGFEGSEVEVISQGLDKYGLKFIERLNGMFFIVAHYNSQMYCFRDRYGIKPAYYYETADMILISSEIKGIIAHPLYKFDINKNVRQQWFTFNNCFTDETLFSGVKKLEKGTIWNVNTGRKKKFWSWNISPDYEKFKYEHTYNEAVLEVRRLVIQAIRRQIPKEVPYASCLSGGVDSNIIASVLKNALTFTAGFVGIDDERELVKLSGHENCLVEFDHVVFFDDTIFHLEDLRVGASWSNYALYRAVAASAFKVLFDGAGSDELFGGYPWRYDAKDYYSVVNRTGSTDDYCKEIFKSVFPSDTLHARMKFDCEHFLEGVLLVVDKLSMAHTIEVRVPFLDNDLVDYCLKLPLAWKREKKILKDAFFGIVPDEILNGPKKGFSSPDWIGGDGNQASNWAVAAYNSWEKHFNTHTK